MLVIPVAKRVAVRKSKDIKALFEGGSERLTDLKQRAAERSRVLDHVRAGLPEDLAGTVATAGVDRGVLTLGAVNAAWATRLRYLSDDLRQGVGEALGVEIVRVRIRVVTTPPPKPSPG